MTAVTEWILGVGFAILLCGVAYNLAVRVAPGAVEECSQACGPGNVARVELERCVCAGSAP